MHASVGYVALAVHDTSIIVQMAGGRAVPIEYDLPQSEVKKRYSHLVKLNHKKEAKVCSSTHAIQTRIALMQLHTPNTQFVQQVPFIACIMITLLLWPNVYMQV